MKYTARLMRADAQFTALRNRFSSRWDVTPSTPPREPYGDGQPPDGGAENTEKRKPEDDDESEADDSAEEVEKEVRENPLYQTRAN